MTTGHPYFSYTSGGSTPLPPVVGFRSMLRRWMGGIASAQDVPPVPVDTPGFGGGRVPWTWRLDDVRRQRQEQEARRGEVELPPVDKAPARDQLSEYVRQSAKVMAAIARFKAESAALEAQIAKLEASQLKRQTARAQRQLMLKRQAQQLAMAQQAALMEEMEAIDVAYCALAAISYTLQ